MKSTKKDNGFSMDDFEKGLVLGGYLMPLNAREISERDALESYQKQQKQQAKVLHFKRVVLAAEITNQLWNEPSFGRVKFQKMAYLCEYAADLHAQHRYQKFAAGPFDNKFIHSILEEFKKMNWFLVEKINSNGYVRTQFKPGPKSEDYLKYYSSYFKTKDEKIQAVITLFKTKSTNDTELAATVLACVLELTQSSPIISRDKLISIFYSWSTEKSKFTESQIDKSIELLLKNKLIDCEIN